MKMNMKMKSSKLVFLSALALFAGCGDDSGNTPGPDPDNNNTPDAGDLIVEDPEPPLLGTQIDRTGRPAIGTALMETFNGVKVAKDAAKDAYNAAVPSAWSGFASSFESSLAILDSLDTVCGNQLLADDNNAEGRYATLASILVDDQLYVNTGSGECGVYLGLEAEIVGAIAVGQGKCGGRMPSDDIIDRSYSVLAAGILSGVDDTITADDCTHSSEFPFLCAPTL
jgi:hypothetical protein